LQNPASSYLPIEEVRRLLERTGYPPNRVHFVQGLVEKTLPVHAPPAVALLLLDTDY
jgi:O-methyltransferase